MIRSEIRTEARRILGDTAATKFASTALNDWIDLANQEIMAYLDLDVAQATMAVVGSDTFASSEPNYQIPSNAMDIKEVYFADADDNEQRIQVIDQDELNDRYGPYWRSDDPGTPVVAYRADYNVLGLYPRPNAAHNGNTFRITYYRIPSDLASDTDSPIYINALHDAVVMWVVSRAYASLSDITRSEYYRKRHEDLLRRFSLKATKFAGDMNGFRW